MGRLNHCRGAYLRRAYCCQALAAIVLCVVVGREASAQEDRPAEPPAAEATDGTPAANVAPAAAETSKEWKPFALAVLLLLWAALGDWINRDSQIHGLGYKQWNPIIFFPFALLAVALLFVPINIWIRFSLLGLALIAPAIPYVVIHNKNVQSHETVLTGSWWRYVISNLLGKVGVKVSTERKAEYEKGAPVDLIAMGAEQANEDNANLLIARQSPGYLLVKDLIVEMVDRRSDKALLNYGPQSVGVKHEIDGVWHPSEARDRESGDVMLAVMKTLANLQVKERRKKQDGQFGAKFNGRAYLCPIVSQGVESGERVMVSLLSEKDRPSSYEALGMREALRNKWAEVMARDQGMAIFAALPGDGLTTLVDVSIDETDRLMRDFVAIEEVHHREHEIQNVAVRTYDATKGEAPADLMPKLVREYPNVYILRDLDAAVGALLMNEISDERLVITTVRARDAADALLRMLQRKLPQKQFASVITAVLYQRLIRKLCVDCKVGYQPPANVLKKLGIPPGKVQQLFRPPKPEEIEKPCPTCRGLGYFGRTGVFELLEVDDQMREILVKQPSVDLLRKAGRAAQQRSLQEEGVLLVAKGVTSLPELMRVLKQ